MEISVSNLFGFNKRKSFFESVLVLVIIFLLVISSYRFVFGTVFGRVEVEGRSMFPTLSDGDCLMFERKKDISRGDIVIIEKQGEDDYYLIKRVIAVGGDSLYAEDGIIYLSTDGVEFSALEEDYLCEDWTWENDIFSSDNPLKIPEGHFFFLGDNRNVSLDSRRYGAYRKEQVIGIVCPWSVTMKEFFTFVHKGGL